MNGFPIIPSSVEQKIEQFEQRIQLLSQPHLTDAFAYLPFHQSNVVYGNAINTYYLGGVDPTYRDWQIPCLMQGKYLATNYSCLANTLNPYGGTTTFQLRYHQVRPQVYSASQIAAETNYVVLETQSLVIPTSGQIVSTSIDLETNFPTIIGTLGYLTLWTKISSALVDAQDNISIAAVHVLFSEWGQTNVGVNF